MIGPDLAVLPWGDVALGLIGVDKLDMDEPLMDAGLVPWRYWGLSSTWHRVSLCQKDWGKVEKYPAALGKTPLFWEFRRLEEFQSTQNLWNTLEKFQILRKPGPFVSHMQSLGWTWGQPRCSGVWEHIGKGVFRPGRVAGLFPAENWHIQAVQEFSGKVLDFAIMAIQEYWRVSNPLVSHHHAVCLQHPSTMTGRK